jgi:predicted SnoaL-like aldol condensation-catalyzing enzyme
MFHDVRSVPGTRQRRRDWRTGAAPPHGGVRRARVISSAAGVASWSGAQPADVIRNGDASMPNGSADSVIARYFDMWNTGDVTIAEQVLHPDWVDHAHPEVAGVAGVQQSVQRVRAARPDLRFTIHSVLGDGDLIAAVGSAGPLPSGSPGQLVWLVRLVDGRMAEMWTYQSR